MVVFGTRPEAIKMAPVVRRLESLRDALETVVTVTGQHREMLDSVLNHFGIAPKYDLKVMKPSQDLTGTMARTLARLGRVVSFEKPDMVLVHGDTLTTLAGALSAYFGGCRLGHVEAGLRTWDKAAPFPEEMMRTLTDHLSDLLFPPTEWARDNLLREGLGRGRTVVTGNTAIDALLMTVAGLHEFSDSFLESLVRRRFILVEVHRRENFGEPLRRICRALRTIAESRRDIELVVSVHPNPNVKRVVEKVLGGVPRVHLFAPFEYVDWAHLMKRSHLIVTDSGGLQEEAPSLGKPVLLAREKTERPEALRAGTVRLVGSDPAAIVDSVNELLDDPSSYERMSRASNPYGDGRAAERVVGALLHYLGLSDEMPAEFAFFGDGGRFEHGGT
ncbi:MAG: UDP-N-acetylglucosamine 2-epimerase (non-hydrolyzing) [Firmicutes bacterium]|jgi:UDP-N-acetylglucosamine 2-epimerase (non-hydrolysing)|nr:UDP-N-acetylglucosamine 2-epimerase (non-hydrolyzing) [Bacillota bacterium]